MREDGLVLESEMFQSLFTRLMTYTEDWMGRFVGEMTGVFLEVKGCVALAGRAVITPYVESSRVGICEESPDTKTDLSGEK